MSSASEATATDERDVLLSVSNLVVEYRAGSGGKVHAVSDVSFELRRGETLGLVGESGSGKSTTASAVMMLPPPSSGSVVFEGTDLARLGGRARRHVRTRLQMIFQDPISSLNPRRRIREIVAEGPSIWSQRAAGGPSVAELLEAVGLDVAVVGDRYPHELSGGQCQRVAIARALALEPTLLICDEAVSALDVSVQAQILNLLESMKQRYRLSMLFIAHDLAVVKHISDRVAVMYLGKLCEIGPPDLLYRQPAHPYTLALIDSIPDPDPDVAPRRAAIEGDMPSPVSPPSGCRFRTRCPRASELCATEAPQMRDVGVDHLVACHHPIVGGCSSHHPQRNP